MSATGDWATYDFGRRVDHGGGQRGAACNGGMARGDRLVIDLDAHHSALSDRPASTAPPRVTGTFSVTKK
jgi:hypothetical protein